MAGLIALYFFYTLTKNKMDTPKDIPEGDAPKKGESMLDKIIFGLLIGGAIGSVLGLTVAPDKGKNVRKRLGKKGRKISERSREILDENEDAVSVVTSKSKGIVSFFIDKIWGGSKKKHDSNILDWISDMEKIPREEEEEVSQ